MSASSSEVSSRMETTPIKLRNKTQNAEKQSKRSIQDLLQQVEMSDLSTNVNEEISLTLSATPSPDFSLKRQRIVHSESPNAFLPDQRSSGILSDAINRISSQKELVENEGIRRRRKATKRDDCDHSEDTEEERPFRKPSRISINEKLTVICDSSPNCSPLHTPSPSEERNIPNFPTAKGVDGFFEFFKTELTRGYSLHNDQARYSEKRKKIYAFLRIPLELEQFLCYGILQCIDAFCYLFTFLPLRIMMSFFGFILRFKSWTSAETCDVIKVIIIVCGSLLIREIDSSVLYHQVRSQSVIKLYIFYNMLEVADRLFSSLGQDILEALFWTATEVSSMRKMFQLGVHLTVAIMYATLHTFLVLLQATTLNVAFNSHNQALLAIMLSNNFTELKGSVLKKFAKANLFQMACSDVRERFHVFALLFVVMIRNMMAVNWSIESLGEMFPDIMMMVGSELLVDWLKHAFITKFNEINAEVYKDFTITIAFDVIKSRDQSAFSDYSDQVSRRMGFIPIPLSIMMIRVLSQTFSINNRWNILICFLGWLVMFVIKICNGIVMLGMACQHVKKYRDFKARAEYMSFRKRVVEKKSKSAPSSPKISLIDFKDVCHQPEGVRGMTVSDLFSQLEDEPGLQSVERRLTDRGERTPRRTKSMANIPRRDHSEPPLATEDPSQVLTPTTLESRTTEDTVPETPRTRENSGQISPKKKLTAKLSIGDEVNEFADVTAYKMPEQGVQRID